MRPAPLPAVLAERAAGHADGPGLLRG
jgi:hypothetical protein